MLQHGPGDRDSLITSACLDDSYVFIDQPPLHCRRQQRLADLLRTVELCRHFGHGLLLLRYLALQGIKSLFELMNLSLPARYLLAVSLAGRDDAYPDGDSKRQR